MSTSPAWTNRLKAALIGLGLGLAVHTSGNWVNILIDRVPQCGQPNCVADFVVFYAEGKLAREQIRSLYDLNKQLEYQKNIAPTERVLPFVYPPITAALFVPLSFMPFSAAFLVMTIASFALLGTSLRLLIRHLPLARDQTQWLVIFALCNHGAQAAVFYGQTSTIILFFMTCHVLAQRRARDTISGFWAGLLCVKPQYLPVPHLYLLLHRQWRGLFVGFLISATLILGAFIVIGAEASEQYFLLAQRMISADDDWWNQWRNMHNLRALTIRWLPAKIQAFVWLTGCALVIASMIRFNLRAHTRADGFAAIWIVNILGLLIVIPHLFTHDLTLLILPCALFLSRFEKGVPISVGLGLVTVAVLPAFNYLFPTIVSIALLVMYGLSVTLEVRRYAR